MILRSLLLVMGSVPIVAAEGPVARAVAVLSPTEGNAAADPFARSGDKRQFRL